MPLEVPNERRAAGWTPPYIYTGLFDEEQKSFEIVGEGKTESVGAKAKAEFLARTCKRFALVGGVRRMQAVDNPNISRATYLRALRVMQRHDDRMGIPREGRGAYPAMYAFHMGDLANAVCVNDTATGAKLAAAQRRNAFEALMAQYRTL